MKNSLIGLLFICIAVFCTPAYCNVVVVVSKKSSIESLSGTEVANIFLARTNRFPDGEKSVPIEFNGDKFRAEFYQSISGKTPGQLMAYWTTLVFTGKGRPPKSFDSYEKLSKQFSLAAGHITYLEQNLVTDDMKIVYRFP